MMDESDDETGSGQPEGEATGESRPDSEKSDAGAGQGAARYDAPARPETLEPAQPTPESFTEYELARDLESSPAEQPPPDAVLDDPPSADGIDVAERPGAVVHGAETPVPQQGEESPQAAESASVPSKPKPCKEAVEALLFAAESPLTPAQIAGLLGKVVKPGQVKEWIDQLAREYDETGRAFQVEEIAGGWRVMTRAEYGHYVRALRITEKTSKLSEAAIDTLSVIAYKQPIIKADINQIRGVESGPILKTLIEKDLVKAVGRSEVAGRPIMYGTSKKFLDHFGLNSLKDLPKPEK